MMSISLLLGLIWSGLWMVFIYVIMKCFPWHRLTFRVREILPALRCILVCSSCL